MLDGSTQLGLRRRLPSVLLRESFPVAGEGVSQELAGTEAGGERRQRLCERGMLGAEDAVRLGPAACAARPLLQLRLCKPRSSASKPKL